MTAPKSLSERLVKFANWFDDWFDDNAPPPSSPPPPGSLGGLLREAADALDQQAAEIERLRADAKDEREDWQLQVAAWKDKADRRADEIERLRAALEDLALSALEKTEDLDRATRNRGARVAT